MQRPRKWCVCVVNETAAADYVLDEVRTPQDKLKAELEAGKHR